MSLFATAFTPLVCSLILVVLLFALWYAPRLWSGMGQRRDRASAARHSEGEDLYETGARVKLLKEIEANISGEQWRRQWLLDARRDAYTALLTSATHYGQLPGGPGPTLLEALMRCRLLASESTREEVEALGEFITAQRTAALSSAEQSEFAARLQALMEKARADLGVS